MADQNNTTRPMQNRPEPGANPQPGNRIRRAQGDGKVSLNRKSIIIIAVLLGIVAAMLVGFGVYTMRRGTAAEMREQQLLIDMAQRDLEREYSDLNDEFQAFENQRQLVMDDSVRRELNDKYEAARVQVERLQQELRDSQNRSAAEIQRLRDEITTLRNLLRHYVEEIDRLNQENQALRTENQQMREQNERLNHQVSQTTRQNEVLSERMTLAERLNVTGMTLQALNKKGKNERKIKKAKQLVVSFTIPQNNSTPVGEKTIYCRIVSPSGQLLEGGGSFSFEGGNVPCTAQKTIEYTGDEIQDLKIYYDVNTPLIAGDYTVELFADNFRLVSRNFTMQ